MRRHHRFVPAVAVAVAVAVAASACTSSSDPARAASTFVPTETAADPAAPDTVRGWVSLSGPVVGATVTVVYDTGAPVATAVTDDLGYFETTAAYGPEYQVIATGGTDDHGPIQVTLRTQMNTADREAAANLGHIDVNVASTLVVGYLDTHPGADEETAEAAVAVAVGAHPDTDIAAIVGTDPDAFNAALFAADDEVIDDAHVAAVATAIATAVTPDEIAAATGSAGRFVDPGAHDDDIAALVGPDPVVAEGAFVLANPVAGIAADIVKGFITDQGKKLLTKWTGLDGDDDTLRELRQMRAQLDRLQVALAEVSAQARQLAADAVYAAAVDATNNVRGGVRTATRLYMEPVAERAIQLGEARRARAGTTGDDIAPADAAVAAAEKNYQLALDNFRTNYNTLAGGAFVKLNLFLEPGPGEAKSIVAKYADTIRARKRFISKADSDAVFAVYADFASWQATAAYLEAEYQSVIGGNVTGAIAMYDEAEARQVAQLPKRLDVAGVVVDLSTNLMWQGAGTPVKNWTISEWASWDTMNASAPPNTPPGPPPFSGWALPTQDQLAGLVRDRGGRSVADYMTSVSTPTGFDRKFWASLSAPIWTLDRKSIELRYVTDPFRPDRWERHRFTQHTALHPNGAFSPLPYLDDYRPLISTDARRFVERRLPDANAHVVHVRSIGADRYL